MWFEPSRLGTFLAELRRRRVVRVAVVYAVVAWAIIEIADTAFPYLDLPEWSVTLVIVLSLTGFPLALLLAWAFEVTPDGVRRTVPAKGDGGSDGGHRHPGLRLVGYGIAGLAGFAGAVTLLPAGAGTIGRDEVGWSSIVVLPFEDLGPDADHAYLGDGIAEEITHALARVDGLRVAARTSAAAMREQPVTVRQIGRDLGVETVLEGSVRVNGPMMRITVQLIDSRRGYRIWSYSDDRAFNDVFAVQEEIARAVVEALGLNLPAGGRMGLVEAPTAHPEAYDFYLRGRRAWSEFGGESAYRNAIAWFERAIAVDSAYALAYIGLADAYIFLGHWARAIPKEEWVDRAQTYLDRALALDPTIGEAYTARSAVLAYTTGGRAWREAEVLVRTAVALSPRYATAHAWLAWNRMEGHGDLEGALAASARAIELDPVSAPSVRNFARAHLYAGQIEEAIASIERTSPAVRESQADVIARIYSAAGRHADAEQAARRLTIRSPDAPDSWLVLAATRAVAGKPEQAREALGLALEIDPDRLVPFEVGLVHGLLGDLDKAWEWLDRGGWTLWDRARLQFDPRYDSIRADPRWPPLFERIKRELDVEG